MILRDIKLVDLQSQHQKIKKEINLAITRVIEEATFINGPTVKNFEKNLGSILNASVITCGNGTDALQISLMALELEEGDEVIVPSFSYVSCAEVIALLNLKPVFADVNTDTFNINELQIEAAITKKTKAIIVVHLFGQCANMEVIMEIAAKHKLHVIEDVAQSLGAEYIFNNGKRQKAGTIAHIGCTSFFPTKILGAFGDGGAMMTKDPDLAQKLRMIATHGQVVKYQHEIVGVNSRLDSIQAAILNVKLNYMDKYLEARREAAKTYNELLQDIPWISTPKTAEYSTQVFNQYTIKLAEDINRDRLKKHLQEKGIPSIVYYPIPLHQQKAYERYCGIKSCPETEDLCNRVLSLPMHTELDYETISFIVKEIKSFNK